MKRIAYIFTLFFMYAIAFWPLIFRHFCPRFFTEVRVCMIVDYVLAITAICLILSMFLLVLQAYKTAFIFALVPLFIEAVILCSALLLFMFHKELTAAMIKGKIKAVGSGIFRVLKTPFALLPFGK